MHLRSILLTLYLTFATVVYSLHGVTSLDSSNFDEVVLQSGKPSLVKFYAPWCGHCKTLAPIFESLAQSFSSSASKVNIVKVDADADKSLAKRFAIQSFPTLKWFDGTSEKAQDYEDGRDLDSLQSYIQQRTGLRPRKPMTTSKVSMLTDNSFNDTIGLGSSVLVAFTAPWCGHCKSLAPIWEDLAEVFQSDIERIRIAKVDAEAQNSKIVVDQFNIKSYPTIKYFPSGSRLPVSYQGERSKEAFVEYVNTKTGCQRLASGRLNAEANMIEPLEQLLKTHGQAGYGTLLDRLKVAATDLEHGYAKYYVKLVEKSQHDERYIEKELARISSILDKGALSPAKIDDLVSRSNILRSFQQHVAGSKQEL